MKGVWAFLKTREWGVQLMRLTHTDPILIKPWASVVLCMAVLFKAHSLRSLRRFSSASMGSSSVKCLCVVSLCLAYMSHLVFWGSALVLFLAKWINLHNQNTQNFWVEICAQILNGVFCYRSRAITSHPDLNRPVLSHWDWPHPMARRRHVSSVLVSLASPLSVNCIIGMTWIWYYKRRTRKLRRKVGLPELYDNDDLPDPIFDPNYVHVLTDKQEYELHHRKTFRSSTL
jgi:hypothetical protein